MRFAAGEAAAADQKILTILRFDIIGRPGPVSCLSGHDGEGHHVILGGSGDVGMTSAGDPDFQFLLAVF